MVGVCCGCIAQPASVQPRKTYNNLVSALFAGEPIKTSEPLDSTLRRKIQKLQEYVQKNPGKIPKVSRRLMRRIRQTLRRPGDNLGHVKVAVHALNYLLAMSADEDASYSPSFFAKEVVSGPDAVVPLLLKDPHIEMRTLGAELLCAFTAVQSEADTQLEAIQALTPLTCRAARAALHAEDADQKVAEAAERRRAGDVLAVPNPIDLITRRAPAHVAALEAACLRCLCEVVSLAARSKVAPDHLDQMQAVALDNLRRPAPEDGGSDCGAPGDASVGGGGTAVSTAGGTAPSACASVVDPEFASLMGVAGRLPSGGRTHDLAAKLLQLLVGFVRDISTVYEVMATFYRYMDGKQRWGEAPIIEAFMGALASSGTQHNFPIFSSLLRHATGAGLPLPDCTAVLGVAARQATKLGPPYAMPALAATLQEVPRLYDLHARAAAATLSDAAAADATAAGVAQLRDTSLALVRQLAVGVTAAAELSEALALGLRRAADDAAGDAPGAAAMAVTCAEAASAAWATGGGGAARLEAPRDPLPGGVLPPSLVSAALAVEAAGGPALRWPLLRILARLLPTAPQGLRTDKQSAALVSAVCRAVFSDDPASWEGVTPADVAATDRLLRACLPGSAARPEAQLRLGRWLLHAAREWGGRGGYAAAGGGDACRACVVLQVFAAAARQLAAGDGAGAVPQLPLTADSCAAVTATPSGLVASAPAFEPSAGCEGALASLEQKQPPLAWAQAAREALLASPALLAEFGERGLAEALDASPAEEARPTSGGPGAKQLPFAERVNALFVKRITTLRKDLAHVSEIMRDSIAPRPSESGALPPIPAAAAIAGGAGGAAAAPLTAPSDSALLSALPPLPDDADGSMVSSLPSATLTLDGPSPPAAGRDGSATAAAGEPLPPATSWFSADSGPNSGRGSTSGDGGAGTPKRRASAKAANSGRAGRKSGGSSGGGGAALDAAALEKALSSGGAPLSAADVQISSVAGELEPGAPTWR